jgi:hypothetical protein
MQESLWPDQERTTGRGSIDHLERYYTPDVLARFCLDLLPWTGIRRVLEPHAGGGAFLRGFGWKQANDDALQHAQIEALDLDPRCWAIQQWGERRGGSIRRADFIHADLDGESWDRVIGNPPFSNAELHVDRGLGVAREVAFLLPVSRFDAGERVPFYQRIPLRKVWKLGERVWPGSRQIGFFWFDREWPHPWWQTEVVSWK